MTADSLIILDDTPSSVNLESALGLSGADAPSSIAAPTPIDFLTISGDVSNEQTLEESPFATSLESDEILSVGTSKDVDTGPINILMESAEDISPVGDVPFIQEVSQTESISLVEDVALEDFALDDTIITMESPLQLEETEDVTPESILTQAIASLKKIRDTTDSKRQAALDLEASLRQQIADEIEAHKEKIANLEESANEARASAEEIELNGKKTKDRINLLEKEIEAV